MKAEMLVTCQHLDQLSFGFPVSFHMSLNLGRGGVHLPRGCFCPHHMGPQGTSLANTQSHAPARLPGRQGLVREGGGRVTRTPPQTESEQHGSQSLCPPAARELERSGAKPGHGPGPQQLSASGGERHRQ